MASTRVAEAAILTLSAEVSAAIVELAAAVVFVAAAAVVLVAVAMLVGGDSLSSVSLYANQSALLLGSGAASRFQEFVIKVAPIRRIGATMTDSKSAFESAIFLH